MQLSFDTYKIVRHYFKGRRTTLDKGLTLAEAQAHCRDPETSSKTAIGSAAQSLTKKRGPWFDGYEKE